MKTNLKPCPFCGNKAEIDLVESEYTWYAGCTKCTCEIQDSSEASVIKEWNTRHDEMTLKKMLLLIQELAIKILALAVLAAGVYSIFD